MAAGLGWSIPTRHVPMAGFSHGAAGRSSSSGAGEATGWTFRKLRSRGSRISACFLPSTRTGQPFETRRRWGRRIPCHVVPRCGGDRAGAALQGWSTGATRQHRRNPGRVTDHARMRLWLEPLPLSWRLWQPRTAARSLAVDTRLRPPRSVEQSSHDGTGQCRATWLSGRDADGAGDAWSHDGHCRDRLSAAEAGRAGPGSGCAVARATFTCGVDKWVASRHVNWARRA